MEAIDEREVMHYQTGLTLIELLVALTIAALVVVIGTPALRRFTTINELAVRSNALQRTLNSARLTAVNRQRTVYVCGDDGTGDCSNRTGFWRHGLLVFVNRDGQLPPHVNGGDELLLSVPPRDKTRGIHSNRRYFRFSPTGGAVNGTLIYCSAHESVHAHAVVVSIMGRIRSQVLGTDKTAVCPQAADAGL